MPAVTIGYGLLLILLGVAGYLLGHPTPPAVAVSKTALIPAAFGVVALILGLVAMKGGPARKHAMHGAAMLSLIGFVIPMGRLIGSIAKGTLDLTKLGPQANLTMAVLSLVFLVLCIRSFIAARVLRKMENMAK